MTAPAELASDSSWSGNTEDIILYTLAVLLVLLIVLVLGYRVTRQRFVSLHQDQSQTVRKHFILIRLLYKETHRGIFLI